MEFNLEEEYREGYLVSRGMKRIWATELDLLKVLLDVCERNGLHCWVDDGTLLGAVRHHGFIPWDDDIDVCMPRKDYDRLLRIGNDEFKAPYFLQSAYSDVDYYRGHAQLRNSNTTAIRPSDSFQPFNQGVFIDIFVLDAVPDDEQKRKEIIRQNRKIQKFLKAKNCAIFTSGRIGLFFRKYKCRRAVKVRGWQKIYKEAEDILRKTRPDDCSRLAELSFSGDEIMFDKHVFDDTLWMDFEDIKVPVPKYYDKFLRTQYGDDYMTPIKDPSYHGEVVFDTQRSYIEVLPEVRREYRNSIIKRLYSKL